MCACVWCDGCVGVRNVSFALNERQREIQYQKCWGWGKILVLLFPFISLSDMSHRSSRSYYDSSSADSHQAGGHDGRHRHRERSRSPQTHRRAARSNYSPEQGSHYGSSSSSNSNNHHHHHNNSSNHHRDNPRYSRYHDNDDYRPDVRCFSPSPPFFCVVRAYSSFYTGGALLWYSITS